jgi:hypothetical protein
LASNANTNFRQFAQTTDVITIEEAGKAPVEFEANDLTRNQPFATLSRWILNHSSAEGGSC